MSAQAVTSLETITGRIEATNERGLKISGQWFNVSRYGQPVDLTGVERGQVVTVAVRDGRWLVEIRPASSDEAATVPLTPANAGGRRSGRNEMAITRLACLRDAVAYVAATRPDASPAEVLELAEAFERWVNR